MHRFRRVRLTADRGFADEDLFAWLDTLGITCIIRVQSKEWRCFTEI
jgi:hypothetical protein